MDKNIFIIGAARSGKTTLSRKIAKKYGYSVVCLDDIICAFESMPECNIKHNGNETETSTNFARFLKAYLVELSEGPNFYNGTKFVIEGTHIDFEQIMPLLNQGKYKEKFKVIGLLYNDITEEMMYKNIKTYDTEDDWTYWCSDEHLKDNIKYFIERNKFFAKKFKDYNVKTYDVSLDREKVLDEICVELFDNID